MAYAKFEPLDFTIDLDGTGTDEWVTQLLLPVSIRGRILGVVIDVDDSSVLGSVDFYALSRNNDDDVTSTPSDRDLAYASATLSPSDDAPTAFLNEVVNYPQTFRGLKIALKLTWTGACQINGTIHIEVNQ